MEEVIRHTIRYQLKRFFSRLPLPVWILIGATLLIVLPLGLIFGIPKHVTFSYAGETCVPQLIIGPSTAKQSTASDYDVKIKNSTSLGNIQLFSTSVCFVPNKVPAPGNHTVAISPFGGWLAAKRFTIAVPDPPVANTKNLINSTIPTTRALKIALSAKDEVFDYSFVADKKTVACDYKETALQCDVPALDLKQGASYDIALERHFNNEHVATLAAGKVATLLPLKQTSASVSESQVIYDKPTELTFGFDKELLKGEVTLKKQVDAGWETVATSIKTNGNNLIIMPGAELPRKTQFELTLDHVEAKDGSALDGPTLIHFSTSGGPKVTGINIPSYGVAQSGTIIINFDQEVANVAKLAELVTAQGATVTVTKSGATLRVAYSAPFCSAFSLSIKHGLESASGIVNDEDWSYKSRTICHTIRTIGASTQGRAINAYIFGGGSKTILYTGSIHGNEHSSRLLMTAWINELEVNPGNIPAGTRIIVVPSLNPDGTAANSRYNARNVDLNRNFNVSDWKKDIQTVNGQPLPNGGGSAPESEVETRVLVNFTKEVAPYLTLSYHSSAAYAIANGCGNSAGLAARYAQLSGYRNMTGNANAFSYEITGTYDDWLCEKLGRQSVLIELATSTNAEFSRNKAALWEMARS